MSRFILLIILANFFVLPIAMGMAEDSPKVACNFSDDVLTKNSTQNITKEGIILENFSFNETSCIIKFNPAIKNIKKHYALAYKNELGEMITSIQKSKKPNITLDDIIKSKMTNPKFSPKRKHNEKIIFDQTVAFIGDMRQLVTLNQRGEHVLYNFSFTESSLNLSDKKRFLAQNQKKNFVVLLNQANPNEKIIFYKKEGKGESIFYYVASGNLFKV